jgi:hypothetical protein
LLAHRAARNLRLVCRVAYRETSVNLIVLLGIDMKALMCLFFSSSAGLAIAGPSNSVAAPNDTEAPVQVEIQSFELQSADKPKNRPTQDRDFRIRSSTQIDFDASGRAILHCETHQHERQADSVDELAADHAQ